MATPILPLVAEPFDRKALEQAIASALLSKQTRIFFDTSTLIWLYGLHEAARAEIVDWATNGLQAGGVHIPRRALHEFSRYRRDPAVLLPFRQQLNSLPRLLEQLDQWAHLMTDDIRAAQYGFESRTKYFAAIKRTAKDVREILKPVTAESSLATLDAALIPFFNRLALNTNIYENLSLLQKEYEARTEVRMPPGFKDAKKTKSRTIHDTQSGETDLTIPDQYGANRFGDFAIWEEILDFCSKSANINSVIILTHDQKPDWVFPGTNVSALCMITVRS